MEDKPRGIPPQADDRISLLRLAQHLSRREGLSSRQVVESLEQKCPDKGIRLSFHWYTGNPHAQVLHGTLGTFLQEELVSPKVLESLLEGWRSFADLIELSEYGLWDSAKNRTALVYASRSDAGRYWPSLKTESTAAERPQTTRPPFELGPKPDDVSSTIWAVMIGIVAEANENPNRYVSLVRQERRFEVVKARLKEKTEFEIRIFQRAEAKLRKYPDWKFNFGSSKPRTSRKPKRVQAPAEDERD